VIYDWATTGKPASRERNIITSLDLDPYAQEIHNQNLQAKYREVEKNEVRLEEFQTDDADYLLVAYGTSARVSQKAVQLARAEGIKSWAFKTNYLIPFSIRTFKRALPAIKGILSVEMSAGQMVEDVLLSVSGKVPVSHFGRMGGVIPTPEEVVDSLKLKIIGG